MKEVIKEQGVIFLILGIIVFTVFAVTGEIEMAIYGFLFIGFVFLLFLGYVFLTSRGVDVDGFVDSLKDVGDTLQDANDTMTYMNMTPKEQAMYNAMKKNKNDNNKE